MKSSENSAQFDGLVRGSFVQGAYLEARHTKTAVIARRVAPWQADFSPLFFVSPKKSGKRNATKGEPLETRGQQGYAAQQPYPRKAFTFPPPMLHSCLSFLPAHAHLYSYCTARFSDIIYLIPIKKESTFRYSLSYLVKVLNQTTPCAIIASATFRKPATFAPSIMSPGQSHSMDAFRHAWKICFMMPWSFSSTSSKVQL